jgi:formylglycine-generating enzyme required for sulfatase activity
MNLVRASTADRRAGGAIARRWLPSVARAAGSLSLCVGIVAVTACASTRPAPSWLADGAWCPTIVTRRTTTKFGYPMRLVSSGRYDIGCPRAAAPCLPREGPAFLAHLLEDPWAAEPEEARLSTAFWIGEVEVTWGVWGRVSRGMLARGPEARSAQAKRKHPAKVTSWVDAAHFANLASAREGLETCYRIDGGEVTWERTFGCQGYRLPTDAEWEVAARALCETHYAGSNAPAAVGWTEDRDPAGPQRVGRLPPNGYGLHDMTGNLAEWVWVLAPAGPPPLGVVDRWPSRSSGHVMGGAWWVAWPLSTKIEVDEDETHGGVGLRLVRSASGRSGK